MPLVKLAKIDSALKLVDWFIGVHFLDYALPSHEVKVLGQWFPIVVWPR